MGALLAARGYPFPELLVAYTSLSGLPLRPVFSVTAPSSSGVGVGIWARISARKVLLLEPALMLKLLCFVLMFVNKA